MYGEEEETQNKRRRIRIDDDDEDDAASNPDETVDRAQEVDSEEEGEDLLDTWKEYVGW